ncbi:MAG: hypothetical protein CMJ59_05750 [Planctomycetaceae bacterium]|nr:hypothetical protein [Planctomycetaceae bacterium]
MKNRYVLLSLMLVTHMASSVFGDPVVGIEILPEPGWIVFRANYGRLRPLPDGASIEVQILDAQEAGVLVRKVETLRPDETTVDVVLNAAALPPGDYRTRSTVLARAGKPIGAPVETSVSWPGQAAEFKGVKILNNVVWELLKVDRETIAGTKTYGFKSPKRRWVYVAATAKATGGAVRVSLGEYGEIMSFDQGEKAVREAMRYLPKGEHKLVIDAPGGGELDNLLVRSIPEILLHEMAGLHSYTRDPEISGLEFYETYVMDNVNTFMADVRNPRLQPRLKKWKQDGGRVLVNVTAKGVAEGITYCPPEELYEYIASSVGFTHPLADGAMLDEFSGPCVNCPSYAEALRKLKATPKFKDKLLYFYDTNIEFNGEQGRKRLRAVVETDSVIMWERYLGTAWDKFLPRPSEAAVRNFFKTEYGLVGMARTCRKWEPTAIEHLAVCFGFFSAPGGHTLATTPFVNHKVFLDMQFNLVANDPAFWGTYGLMGYHSSYSDEETLRWICRLFRHYGIEGNTAPATDDPYESPHLANGDFADGTERWTISAAEPGGIRTARKPGLSALQTRYGSSEGDTGLVTTRSAKGPNTIAQEINNLQPGRLYTFRLIACDYQDLSKREKPAVRVKLDGVDLFPDKSFAAVFPDASFVSIEQHKTWLTYHWVLFRAAGERARVTITDWATDDQPGGPIGQQLIFNYLQVHPYFAPQDN